MENLTERTVSTRTDPAIDIKANNLDGPIDVASERVPAPGLSLNSGSREYIRRVSAPKHNSWQPEYEFREYHNQGKADSLDYHEWND